MGNAAVTQLAGCGAGGGYVVGGRATTRYPRGRAGSRYDPALGETEDERPGTPAGLVFDFLFDQACWWPPPRDPEDLTPWREAQASARGLPACREWWALFGQWRGLRREDTRIR